MKTFILSLTFIFFSSTLWAHGNHHHGPKLKETEIVQRAKFELLRLVRTGKIEASWKENARQTFV